MREIQHADKTVAIYGLLKLGGPAMRSLVMLVALIMLCVGLAQTSQGTPCSLSDVGLYEPPVQLHGTDVRHSWRSSKRAGFTEFSH